MTRSILAALAAVAAVTVLSGTGCNSTGVGDPCVPEQEYDPTFLGFNVQEVNVESKSFQCQTRLCLVNHFQGLVSCPYGQDSQGNPPPGAKTACLTPGIQQKVTGNPADPKTGATVQPTCADRTADKAVYCSCRCANVDGQTNDGANYCTCPDGFKCTPLVSSIGAADQGLTGSYCIKTGTEYDPNKSCGSECEASAKNCGNTQLQ
jgi:hypothetical protein